MNTPLRWVRGITAKGGKGGKGMDTTTQRRDGQMEIGGVGSEMRVKGETWVGLGVPDDHET